MAEIKLSIGSKKEKKTFKHVVSGADAEKLVGKKIGEKFRGEIIGLVGYELEITGGSDKSGFPMRQSIQGSSQRKIIISKGVGFKPKRKGQRKRRTIRGNTISKDTAQVNCKVIKAGKERVSKILGISKEKPETKDKTLKETEEAPKEEKKEESKEKSPSKEQDKKEEPAKEKEEPKKKN